MKILASYLVMQDNVQKMNQEAEDWFENWTIQMRKGMLDLCILSALLNGDRYGYALVKSLVAIPGVGVAEGSIYPLLARLKKQGLVTTRLEESNEGPARKYYSLTKSGHEQAVQMARHFTLIIQGMETLGKVDFMQEP